MEKLKVIVVGVGHIHDRTLQMLKEHKAVFDIIEIKTHDESVKGQKFNKAIFDDLTPVGDFSYIEERVTGNLLKGQVNGHRIQQDSYQEYLQYSKPYLGVMPRNRQESASHPSRKREPKGPRGRWGKL